MPAEPADIVGRHFRLPDYYEVGREKVREYARAVLDPHPAHRNEAAAADLGYAGLIAPLTFASLLGGVAQQRVFTDLVTGYDLSQVLHTAQRQQFHRPVMVGDRLNCDIYVDSFRRSHGQDLIVIKNVITDRHGALVQTTWTTMVAATPDAATRPEPPRRNHPLPHGQARNGPEVGNSTKR
ncbi:(3R)-hydroxyacyl-ACP dehydratase subunit HadA [Rhodococcus sp. NPDC059968]|uniref:(3R)-hydroxyacyl-ACP dehydratase subunit HadA n=1 Tax=Rhodococcus sp. NPDC059968 TaxID=3347017 RepID=UPI003671598B